MSARLAYAMAWLSFAAYLVTIVYNPMDRTIADRGVLMEMAVFFILNAIYARVPGPVSSAGDDA